MKQPMTIAPPPFADGLDGWSLQGGKAGMRCHIDCDIAAYTPADFDFGGCLEIALCGAPYHLRFDQEICLVPGCYLQVTTRVKSISGGLVSARVAGSIGDGTTCTQGRTNTMGALKTVPRLDEVVELRAIVNCDTGQATSSARGQRFGQFGIDLFGPPGCVVRVDDVDIEDITASILG